MFEILNRGGFFMYIILTVSVVAMALIAERVYVLWFRLKLNMDQFLNQVMTFVENNNFSRAIEVCNQKAEHPLAVVLKAGLMKANRSDVEIERALEEEAIKQTPRISQRTHYLAMLGNISTLLGLLGTIFGLIRAFEGVGLADAAAKQEALAKGISVAMFTTAFGLVVAIPCLISYAILQNRQNQLIDGMEEKAVTLFNQITARNRDKVLEMKRKVG